MDIRRFSYLSTAIVDVGVELFLALQEVATAPIIYRIEEKPISCVPWNRTWMVPAEIWLVLRSLHDPVCSAIVCSSSFLLWHPDLCSVYWNRMTVGFRDGHLSISGSVTRKVYILKHFFFFFWTNFGIICNFWMVFKEREKKTMNKILKYGANLAGGFDGLTEGTAWWFT